MANKDNGEETIDTKQKKDTKDKKETGKEEEKDEAPLDTEDIKLLMKYGKGPYFEK